MTKNKPIPKRKEYFMKTHSRKTGKIILIVLGLLIAGGLSFMYLAIQESERINNFEKDWRLQSCQDMQADHKLNPEQWKFNAITDKCLTD